MHGNFFQFPCEPPDGILRSSLLRTSRNLPSSTCCETESLSDYQGFHLEEPQQPNYDFVKPWEGHSHDCFLKLFGISKEPACIKISACSLGAMYLQDRQLYTQTLGSTCGYSNMILDKSSGFALQRLSRAQSCLICMRAVCQRHRL